jgi:DNA repair exonuclease SbcCD ATPase subunit
MATQLPATKTTSPSTREARILTTNEIKNNLLVLNDRLSKRITCLTENISYYKRMQLDLNRLIDLNDERTKITNELDEFENELARIKKLSLKLRRKAFEQRHYYEEIQEIKHRQSKLNAEIIRELKRQMDTL